MVTIEIVISLEQRLLERIDRLAGELRIPRDQLMVRAAEQLLTRYENQQLLRQLNRVHGVEEETHEEQRRLRRLHRPQYRRLLAEDQS